MQRIEIEKKKRYKIINYLNSLRGCLVYGIRGDSTNNPLLSTIPCLVYFILGIVLKRRRGFLDICFFKKYSEGFNNPLIGQLEPNKPLEK